MIPKLDAIEARILGSLIEKSATTPEYYPLTLNSLLNACNQKSSRDPVMGLDVQDINSGLSSLISKKLVTREIGNGSVPKFRHKLAENYRLSERQSAVLAIMLLRGPQTPGELKTRTDRYCSFENLGIVQKTLVHLQERQDGPFVKLVGRKPGQKEARYNHCFGREEDTEESSEGPTRKQSVLVKTHTKDEKMEQLTAEVRSLQKTVETLEKRIQRLEEGH